MATRRTRRRTHTKAKKTAAPKKRQGLTQKQTKLASLVKKANQRLRELEKHNLQTPSYNYVKALYDSQSMTMSTTKNGEIKFRTDITKMSKEQQTDLEKTVNDFLQAKTSTVKGLNKYFEGVTESFNERYGTDYKQDEVADAISNANFQELVKMFGSKEAVRIIKESGFGDMTEEEQKDFIEEHGTQLNEYLQDYKPQQDGQWEENEPTNWRLHSSKYGLTDTGRLW